MRRETRGELAVAAVDDIRRIIRVLRVASRQAERELGLGGAQLFVLQKLAERPAGSLNELAERTLTHQSSVSVVVRGLVGRGLVARDRSLHDARRVELHLTAAGERLLKRAPSMPQIKLVETVRRLGKRDLGSLARLLHRLVEGMGAVGAQPEMVFVEEATARLHTRTSRGKRGRRSR